MAKTIVENMERERDAGNLELGKVGESSSVEFRERKRRQVESLEKEDIFQEDGIEEVSAEELFMDDVGPSRFGGAENL